MCMTRCACDPCIALDKSMAFKGAAEVRQVHASAEFYNQRLGVCTMKDACLYVQQPSGQIV